MTKEGLSQVGELDLESVLKLAKQRHDQRLQILATEGVQLEQGARSSLCSCLGRSYVSRMVPSDLTMAEYVVRTTELGEQEAEQRLKLCCEQCPPGGGACEGLDREGLGPMWTDGIEWFSCAKWSRYKLDRKLTDSGYPSKLLAKSFADIVKCDKSVADSRDECQKYVRQFGTAELRKGQGLLLSGASGVGKTHLIVATARELHRLRKIRTSRFWDTEYLVFSLRQQDDETKQIMQEAMDVDLLVLDDFNVSNATKWAATQIAMIINHRWGKELPILMTTNETLDEQAAGSLDERVIGRLIEIMDKHGYELLGRDHRFPEPSDEG